MDIVAVKTFVPDLHVGAERVDSGKILDREANRFRGRGEATIAESQRTASAPCHEQFGWQLIVEFHVIACGASSARGGNGTPPAQLRKRRVRAVISAAIRSRSRLKI